ncbi:Uncharacterized membrane protein [Bacillus sp. 71mf]|uniref:DUF2085 domain-containing protein n=2 Tax=unclassified Bacillus (in: firmicutes) TaxID=185979 RepID=UPI0008EAC65B|nr:DUF2085 domain-containing protein [Bacillus sp. 103mf]SFI79570.1 Uncharacterized membrane protein [Bacillus sp. 71mf]SFS85763.1 Uncharacterized membrane protein [Bacillus sp. 103mf]
MVNKYIEKVLYIVPCHRKPSRCFHVNGTPLPICARCTGILIGYLFIPFLLFITYTVPISIGILAQIPMFVDGYTQLKKWRESNNLLRILTGLLSGFGLSVLVVSGARLFVTYVQIVFIVTTKY